MYPPIYKVCSSNPAVTAILGASPLRMYQFGLAPSSSSNRTQHGRPYRDRPRTTCGAALTPMGSPSKWTFFRPLLRRLEMPPWPSGMRLSFQPM